MPNDLQSNSPPIEGMNEGRPFHGNRFIQLIDQTYAPYAFVRCDFIQVCFDECKFNGTDFTNSDFTGVVFENTYFTSCNLMSTAYSSCVFEDCHFYNNRNFNCDLIECAIVSSKFESQLIDRSVWRNTDVSECSFTSVTLRRSTWDGVTISRTYISGINFMDNYCVSCTFENCTFDDSDFDASYFGLNVFRQCDISGLRLRYKDEYLQIDATDPDTLKSLAGHYEKNQQYAESFNINLFLDLIEDKSSSEYPVAAFSTCLHQIIKLRPHTLVTQQLRLLFQVVDIDYRAGKLSSLNVLTLDAICATTITALDDLTLREKLVRFSSFLRDVASKVLASEITLESGDWAHISLTFDGNETSTAIDHTDKLLSTVIGADNYRILGVRTGCIIVDVLTYAGAAVVLAATVRIVSGYAVSIYLEFLSTVAIRRVIGKAESFDDLEKINKLQLTRNLINAGAAALHTKQIDGLKKLEMKL